jgi:ABC-type transport system substrate-binding protein
MGEHRGRSGITRRTFLARSGAALAAVSALPAFRPSPASAKPSGTVTWGRAFKARARDPHLVNNLQEVVLARQCMEPLLELELDGKFRPILAESWRVSRDGLTWTFDLRKGVKFHDGTPFEAEAVKLAFERVKGNPKSGFAFLLENCEDRPVRIVNKHRIEIRTKTPEAALPYNLQIIFIPHPEAATNRDLTWDKAIGTGPFRMVEFEVDRNVRYEAFGDYWRPGFPKIQTLIWRPIVEQSSLAAATQAGELDLVDGLSPDNALPLRTDPRFDLVMLDAARVDFYILNTKGEVPALADPKVRQAMSFAFDRSVIANEIMGGAAAPWATYPPRGIMGATDKLPANPYDLARARELMKQSKFSNGFEATIRVPRGVGTHGKQKEISEYVSQEWAKIGIWTKVEVGEGPAMQAQFREGKYAIAFSSSVAMTGDPDRYFRERIIGDMWKTGYSPAPINQLIERAGATIDERKRQALYEEIQQKMWEDMPVIYLQQTKFIMLKKKNVSGLLGLKTQVLHMTELSIA